MAKNEPVPTGNGDNSVLEPSFPKQSPLFHAQHSERYGRQELIREYEEEFNCSLVVMIDEIFPFSVTLFEELIYSARPDTDLHIILSSPGGDGETALRLVRSVQQRCKDLTVVVPDQAKSAATLFALGAHQILMGPAGDLGPVDPQFQTANGLKSAYDIIGAVNEATSAVEKNPETYALRAALLKDYDAVLVQQAHAALNRSTDLLAECLRSNPDRSEQNVQKLHKILEIALIDDVTSHGAVFGFQEAQTAGLPVLEADPQSQQWQLIWRLWSKYFMLMASQGNSRVYEGRRESVISPYGNPNN